MRSIVGAESGGLSLCKTCIHAERAGHLTREEDLYVCRALIPSLRDYAGSGTPEYILVNGCAPACLEHYERDEAAFDFLWQEDVAWDDALAFPPVIQPESLQYGMQAQLW